MLTKYCNVSTIKISQYFNCFDYKINDSYSFHENLMNSIRLLDIDIMMEQNIACYKGWVYYHRMEVIENENIRKNVSKYLSEINHHMCWFSNSSLKILESNPYFHVEPKECLRSAVSYSDIFSNREKYEKILNETKISYGKLCAYREYHYAANFTSFKNSSDCFSNGPKDADLKVKTCYKKIFDSLMIHYDKDFILCGLDRGAIRKLIN